MASLYTDTNHTELYRKYRPTYPQELFNIILMYLHNNGERSRKMALDVACGSGQATLRLCDLFEMVVGIDASEAQIIEAGRSKRENLSFRVGRAEDLSFQPENSVDLVTVASALHWFENTEAFYREVKRVLRPGGVLAAICAVTLGVFDRTEAQTCFEEFFNSHLRPYAKRLQILKSVFELQYRDLYADLTKYFATSERIDTVVREQTYNMDEFIGFIRSNSIWQMYEREHPHSSVLQDLQERLQNAYRDQGENLAMKTKAQVVLLLARKT